MIKNKITLLLLLIFSFSMSAQDTPREYNKVVRKKNKAAKKLLKSDEIDVVLDGRSTTPAIVEYDGVPRNWGLDFHKQKEAIELINKMKDKEVVTFVFDTEGDYIHRDLQYCELDGYNAYSNESPFGQGHGVHVAGIIGADNQNIGIARPLAIDNFLKIVPVKVLNLQNSGSYSKIAEGIAWALDKSKIYISQGRRVNWNFSLGGGGFNQGIDNLFLDARKMGIIVVAAAGNNSRSSISFPAKSESALAVAALDENGKKAHYSNWGTGLMYSSAGSRVYSLYRDNKYATLSGTSMASPMMCGIFAIAQSCLPKLSSEQIIQHVNNVSIDMDREGYDTDSGFGYSLIIRILKTPFDGTPDDPDSIDPPDEETKTITFFSEWSDSLNLVWGYNFKNVKSVDVSFEVETSVTGNTGATGESFNQFTRWFFTNRGILFTERGIDISDVAFYAAHFYNMFAGKAGFETYITKVRLRNEKGVKILMVNPAESASIYERALKTGVQCIIF